MLLGKIDYVREKITHESTLQTSKFLQEAVVQGDVFVAQKDILTFTIDQRLMTSYEFTFYLDMF
jgi:hypothetical protein